MIDPFDIERAIHEIFHHRFHGDELAAETGRLADKIADGFRADFDTSMDMEDVGKVLVIAAASLVPLATPDVPSPVLVNMIGMAGESLVRTVRARDEQTLRDVVDSHSPAEDGASDFEGELWEHVLTWHPLNGKPPVEVPFDQHWVFSAESCGEFRLSTREVPEVPGG